MEIFPRQIALLHAQRNDVNLLNSLLNEQPFEVVPHDDVHSIAERQFNAEVSPDGGPDTYGVVVCARATVTASDNPTDVNVKNDVAGELGQLIGRVKRVLVLADTMDELTVCSYLGAGAHHVIPINDSPRLMKARLIAGLRQHSEPAQKEWHIGPFHFDLSRRTIARDGENLRLSPREFELAYYLFEHRAQAVPTTDILKDVWSLPECTDSRRVDTAACRVRKKLMLDDESEWQLRRVRREGYQLVCSREAH